MKKIINHIVTYKNKNFGSWLEFIMTWGICRFEDGGFMIFIYGWGGLAALIGMLIIGI